MAKKTPPLRACPPRGQPADALNSNDEKMRRLARLEEWANEPGVDVARALVHIPVPPGTAIEVLSASEVQRLRGLEAENLKLRQEVDALRGLLGADQSRSATDGV